MNPVGGVPDLSAIDPTQPGVVTSILNARRGTPSVWSLENYGGGIPVVTPVMAMLGLNGMFERLIAIASLTAAVLWLRAPRSMFISGPSGVQGRAFSLWSTDREGTYFPWWLVALLTGAFFALFA